MQFLFGITGEYLTGRLLADLGAEVEFSKNIIIIGSSSGGPLTLRRVLAKLPVLDASILIVQHMPKFINDTIRESLSRMTDMRVRLAEDRAMLEDGKVFVAPSEVHMEIEDNRRIRLRQSERVNFVCPSIDVTMQSIRHEPGLSTVGVILTGIGRDGAQGISHIKCLGGTTIAQDSRTCVVYGMPKAAVETGNVDFVLTPEEIREKLIELVKGSRGKNGNVSS
ncbi:MAG: CheB methylesterase domain-containing protein [Dehalococcoidia bacterium]|nr:CheB methylesterase domain-containing protein [Dehalococcoidia bacterium]